MTDWTSFEQLTAEEQQELVESWEADSYIEWDKANAGIEDNY